MVTRCYSRQIQVSRLYCQFHDGVKDFICKKSRRAISRRSYALNNKTNRTYIYSCLSNNSSDASLEPQLNSALVSTCVKLAGQTVNISLYFCVKYTPQELKYSQEYK
jgi:hypothetical protein